MSGKIADRDLIIEAIQEWVDGHPEEAKMPIKFAQAESGTAVPVSVYVILEEMKKKSDLGKQEYKGLVKLTVDLLLRGKLNKENGEEL